MFIRRSRIIIILQPNNIIRASAMAEQAKAETVIRIRINCGQIDDEQVTIGIKHKLQNMIEELEFEVESISSSIRQALPQNQLERVKKQESRFDLSQNIDQKKDSSADQNQNSNGDSDRTSSEQENKKRSKKYSRKRISSGKNNNFQCGICLKYFQDCDALQRHERQVHQKLDHKVIYRQSKSNDLNNPYPCKICDQKRMSLYLIQKHYAIDHEEQEFNDKNLKIEHYVSKQKIIKFKAREALKLNRVQGKHHMIEDEEKINQVLEYLKSNRESRNSFPLHHQQQKLLYDLFKKADEEVLELDIDITEPKEILQDNGSLLVYPFTYFNQHRHNQVQINSVYLMLKMATIMQSKYVVTLQGIKRNAKYIAFKVEQLSMNLDEYLQTFDPCTADRRRIAYHVLKGISHIHSNGFVHRDVKPQNIILSRDGQQIKISCFTDPSFQNESRLAQGKDLNIYSPPNHINLEEGSTLWDFYSFGVICYRLLIGEEMFNIDLNNEGRQSIFTAQIIRRYFGKAAAAELLCYCLLLKAKDEAEVSSKINSLFEQYDFEPRVGRDNLNWLGRYSKGVHRTVRRDGADLQNNDEGQN